jgi:hypothetical protein
MMHFFIKKTKKWPPTSCRQNLRLTTCRSTSADRRTPPWNMATPPETAFQPPKSFEINGTPPWKSTGTTPHIKARQIDLARADEDERCSNRTEQQVKSPLPSDSIGTPTRSEKPRKSQISSPTDEATRKGRGFRFGFPATTGSTVPADYNPHALLRGHKEKRKRPRKVAGSSPGEPPRHDGRIPPRTAKRARDGIRRR